jgi:hypothetical protein
VIFVTGCHVRGPVALYLLEGADVTAARIGQSLGDVNRREGAVMAEKIVKFIHVFRGKDKTPRMAGLPVLADHPLLHLHRAYVSPDKAKRLGEFALQFLH